MIEADLRRELLEAFEGEYREHLSAMRAALDDAQPVSGAVLRDVFRRAHSLKGAARAVELPRVERIAHELETLLHGAIERNAALGEADAALVGRGLDEIEAGMAIDSAGPADAAPVSGAAGEATVAEPAAAALAAQVAAEAAQPGTAEAGSRIAVREIDRLVETAHAAGEAMAGQEHGRRWLREHADALRALLGQCEAGGASATAQAEIAHGVRTLLQAAERRLRDGGYEDRQRERTAADLRAQVERVALVSADSVFGPLAAMARALAREGGLEIEVRLRGMELLAERPVLQALRDPAIQLVRNAVGHGLRDRRPGADPPLLELSVEIRAGRLLLGVSDNGGGPDLGSIAARARQQGLIDADDADPPEAALLAMAFEPGFSTAAAVDRLSGRGMGLSIVAEAARRLGGTAAMRAIRDRARAGAKAGAGAETGPVRGTLLLVEVPLAARRQALLLLEAGGHTVALPAGAVRRLRTLPRGRIERDGSRLHARLGPERRLPVRRLGELLGAPDAGGAAPWSIVELDGVGLLAERLLEVRTLVVRAPAVVGLDRALAGGIASWGGRPMLVLEPDGLRDAALRDDGAIPVAAASVAPARPAAPRRRATVLVVDDSITTRTLEKTILQAQGFHVLIAVDGMEALAVLRGGERGVDVVVADVEMPRLDGFGLVAAMQADPLLRAIPAVLMTSRNSEQDIRRGLDLGARAYLTKQEFEQGALLSVIGQLLP